MDKRAQIILKTLVERYISEGEPVGSRVLSRQSGLELSPATVRSHLQNLYGKLGVSTQAAAVAEAMRRGLVS